MSQPPITETLDTPQLLQSYLNSCPPGLLDLDLTNQNITSLEGIAFSDGLKKLNLSDNQITSLTGVKFPANLMALNLMSNGIKSLEGVHFPHTLMLLSLGFNPIWSNNNSNRIKKRY